MMNRLPQSFFLLIPLLFLSFACDDSTKGKGQTPSAGDEGIQEDQGDDASTAGNMKPTVCFDDTACSPDEFCAIPEGEFRGECKSGCKSDRDCLDGKTCNTETHTCEFPTCSNDSNCPDGTYCGSDQVCQTGCRMDNCEADPSGKPVQCNPETRQCETLSACCIENGATCEQLSETACNAQNGKVLVNSLTCDQDPCANPCATDGECTALDGNNTTYYCDSEDGRCRPGCRADRCEGAQICDPESKVCTDKPCAQRTDCGVNQYCDPIDQVCRVGCGQDSDCSMGFGCVNNLCVERCNPSNDTCGLGNYCDPSRLICRPDCQTHLDCADNEACDPIDKQCKTNTCRDDETTMMGLTGEPNNTVDQATELILLPVAGENGKFISIAAQRILCGVDTDLYRLTLLNSGDRMRITLNYDNGNLGFRLYEENLNNLKATIDTLRKPERIDYPDADVVIDAHTYYIEVFGDLDGINFSTYQLDIQVVPLGDACFADIRENAPGDDNKQGATPLLRNEITYFDDSSICSGDQDFFKIDMNVNDGWTVEVRTDLNAPPLTLEIYSESSLSAISGSMPMARISGAESVIEGQFKLYRFVRDFETAAFTDEPWYVKVSAELATEFTTYEITSQHQASASSCVADMFEPNDSAITGKDAAMTFQFMLDNNQLLAQGRDYRILGANICAGDIDYWCVNLGNNDLFEAWLISDDAVGNLSARIVNTQGVQVGSAEVRQTATGAPPQKVTFYGAPTGRYCIEVDGLANAQGSYELNIRRDVSNGVCGADIGEMMTRDDSSMNAKSINDVSQNGSRFEYLNGLVCDVNGQEDVDWYKFPVASPSKICASLSGFANSRADLDLAVYGVPRVDTLACVSDATCIMQNRGDTCIEGHCQTLIPQDNSSYIFDFELVRKTGQVGSNYLKVSRGAMGGSEPYRLTVSVTADNAACTADWRETNASNDQSHFSGSGASASPTVLGAGDVGICDAWLCNNPVNPDDEDWYQITIPAGQDRTVLVNKTARTPIVLYSYAFNADYSMFDFPVDLSPDFIPGFAGSDLPDTSEYHCLNIKGGTTPQEIELGVLSPIASLPSMISRADYALRIVPTNLNTNPEGECRLFGAPVTQSCGDPFDPFNQLPTNCVPTLILP
jgi:hypothetical protein